MSWFWRIVYALAALVLLKWAQLFRAARREARDQWEDLKQPVNSPGLYVSPQIMMDPPDYSHVYRERVQRAVEAQRMRERG